LPAIQYTDRLANRLFTDLSPESFNGLALEIFQYQYRQNDIYGNYIRHLGVDVNKINTINQIPFLPIEFFKSQKVVTGNFKEEIVFESSGTSGMQAAKHYVKDLTVYDLAYRLGFQRFYGDPEIYCILALLPSYLERKGSSLVYMADKLIGSGKHPFSGFFLEEHKLLAERLHKLNEAGTKTILIGVAFALLDFAEEYPMRLGDHITIMETGGMKGRKQEITRQELHAVLKKGFGKDCIHSEYGMTELLSQAYSKGEGKFNTPPWMKVFVRDIQDPLSILPPGKSGALNIIDLANIHSCAFIGTQDIGRIYPDGSFELLGRTDHSDIRGCSLLLQ
jgi:phenylacetate-coenzyme A ligase PaaK-like adenylate-forming protein